MQTGTQVHKHLLITGRVQGVGYRYSMRHIAVELGLTGWCRNLPGGEVEAEVFGPPDAVEKLLVWSHQGPPYAEVTGVTVQDLPVETFSPPTVFEIRR